MILELVGRRGADLIVMVRRGLGDLAGPLGGVTLETVRAIAETGVERISVGRLTHATAWLDIGLDIP